VHEETGITGNIAGPLGVINFWFIAENRRIHKTVHHFLMFATGGELSDDDAEVDAVEWVPLEKVSNRLAYTDERRLLVRAHELLVEHGVVHHTGSAPELDAQ
jgi:8-oxo-dGTP pyrophosphatase MutT (NUDIX family)